jgi:hypothetical protein
MAGTGSGVGPGDAASGPDDINDHLDEIAAELAREAKFKELSAAERAKRARGAQRGSRQPRRPRASAEWRPTAPGRRGRTRSLVITLTVIAALIGASFALTRLHLGGHDAAKPDSTPTTNRATPSALPTARTPLFTSADPFAGSPAAGYADGATGIVIPAARTVGGYSAAEVGAAYATVRKLLIAGYLNQAVLAGGSPTAFARILTPSERSYFLKNLRKHGVDSQGNERSTRAWVISFAPGSTELVGDVIKVHGSMSAGLQRTAHVRTLSIHADYLFVYPVQQQGGPASTRMRIVARAFITVLFAAWDDPGGPLQAYLATDRGGSAGALCGINDGYVHPDFPGEPQGVRPSGVPLDPYDQSTPPPAHAGCQATTGT